MESAENREQSKKVNPPTNESSKSGRSNDSQSLSKVETLKLLNDSIDRLEETIKGISENSASDLPSSASINELLNTAQELAKRVASPQAKKPNASAKKSNLPPKSKQTPEAEQPKTDTPVQPATPTNKTPTKKRTVPNVVSKPKAKKQKTTGLITIGVFAIAIAAIIIFWLWFPQEKASLVSTPQPEAQEIIPNNPANIGDSSITNNKNRSVPKSLPEQSSQIQAPKIGPTDIADIAPDTIDTISQENQSTAPTNFPSKTKAQEPESESPEKTLIPQDLTSPGKSQNLNIETIKPELTFTPEQTLIAALQSKIANLSEDYGADLIDSIKVNLLEGSLQVEVSDRWYELNGSNQNKTANEILQRSRKFKFKKLELQDSRGTMVARNPVVGDQIIILQSAKKIS